MSTRRFATPPTSLNACLPHDARWHDRNTLRSLDQVSRRNERRKGTVPRYLAGTHKGIEREVIHGLLLRGPRTTSPVGRGRTLARRGTFAVNLRSILDRAEQLARSRALSAISAVRVDAAPRNLTGDDLTIVSTE